MSWTEVCKRCLSLEFIWHLTATGFVLLSYHHDTSNTTMSPVYSRWLVHVLAQRCVMTEANHGGYVDWPQISGLHSGYSGGARLVCLAAGSSACTLCSPGAYGNSTGGFRFAGAGVLVSVRFCACILTTQKQVSPKSAWPVTAVAPPTPSTVTKGMGICKQQ